ncbi:MAG TPA: LLM class flavin-dependent oxidoreductase [Streptomyces sp.]
MRIGVFLLAAGFPGVSPERTLRAALEYAGAAEDAGFDDVFVAEHHFMPYGTCPSALTFAAVLAGRTRSIGVGTAVTVLSTAHPVAVAEQAAMLDVLTGGRFTLGVGRGGPWVDLEVFGTGLEGLSRRAFAEALDVLGAWASQDAVSYDGEFHRFRSVPVVPRGRAPMLVACTSPETVGMAAERRLPMLRGRHVDDAEKAARVRASGAPPPHASVVVAQVAASREAGVSLLRQTMPTWLRPGMAAHVRFDGTTPPMRDPDAYAEFLTTIHPVGPASYCADRILESAEATGIEHFLLFVEGGGPEHTLENIKALGSSVLPLLRTPTHTEKRHKLRA